MEKAAAGTRTGSGWEVPLVHGALAVVAACVACPAAWAQDLGQKSADLVAAQARVQAPLRVQVEATALPRLDAQDTGFQSPRVDVSLLPNQPSGLGAMVGMSALSPRQGLQPPGLTPSRAGLDLGVRWTQRLQSRQRIDITAWRRMTTDDDAYSLIQMQQPVYGARVEMNLAGGRSRFALERGFVGLQLESGAKISIKRRYGGPMVYYRTTF